MRQNQATSFAHEIPTNTNSNSWSSEGQVKTSLSSGAHHSWLTITLGLIAIAGILGTVGVTVVAVVVLRQTKTTSTSTSELFFSFLSDNSFQF